MTLDHIHCPFHGGDYDSDPEQGEVDHPYAVSIKTFKKYSERV